MLRLFFFLICYHQYEKKNTLHTKRKFTNNFISASSIHHCLPSPTSARTNSEANLNVLKNIIMYMFIKIL